MCTRIPDFRQRFAGLDRRCEGFDEICVDGRRGEFLKSAKLAPRYGNGGVSDRYAELRESYADVGS